jgi:micrococcal nuclease
MYEYKAILKRVVDGDTVDLIIDMGFRMTTEQRIRLKSIDTPEIWRKKKTSKEFKKGMEAKNYVIKRFKENGNECTINTDSESGVYGRYIAEIYLKDSDISLNDELVKYEYAKPTGK